MRKKNERMIPGKRRCCTAPNVETRIWTFVLLYTGRCEIARFVVTKWAMDEFLLLYYLGVNMKSLCSKYISARKSDYESLFICLAGDGLHGVWY